LIDRANAARITHFNLTETKTARLPRHQSEHIHNLHSYKMEFGWGSTGNEMVDLFKDNVRGKTCKY
jgi:hypothetical protein